MELKAMPVDQILAISYPSYHRPLEAARVLGRSPDLGERARPSSCSKG